MYDRTIENRLHFRSLQEVKSFGERRYDIRYHVRRKNGRGGGVMVRYIDADKLARELAIELEKTKVPRKNEKSNIPYLLNLDNIYYALSVLSVTEAEDVAPVVHAQWHETEGRNAFEVNLQCPKCAYDFYVETMWKDIYKYCPQCGAIMDEVAE